MTIFFEMVGVEALFPVRIISGGID